ncbi:DMT family transporter [Hallella multisaccharivorax]|uniref:DMT family transporter n=1 Tax=Hallella multisaccharivorax TaxID=310514 RepID=UPI0036148DC4
MMSNSLKGFSAGILAAVFYGTNPLGTLPLYADGISSGSVLFYRYALSVIFFAAWLLARGESLRIQWGHAIRLAVLGVMFSMSSLTLYESFHYMNAGVASTILFSYPIMTALIMVMFYHERVNWRTTAAIVLAVSGIALLYRGGGEGGSKLSATGILLVLFSSLLYAMYIVYVRQFRITGMSAEKSTAWIVFFGWLGITAFMLFKGEPLQLLRGTQWLWGAQLALLPTVMSLFLINVAIKCIGSTPTAIMGAIEPLTAVAISCTLFGEPFTLRLSAGIVLILSAVILIILRKQTA